MTSTRELLALIDDALSQAQDCIRGETPEDMTDAEAREATVSEIREAMRAVATLRAAPVTQCGAEPVGWLFRDDGHRFFFDYDKSHGETVAIDYWGEPWTSQPLYATPPSRFDAVNATVPHAKPKEVEGGWRVDVDWLAKMQADVEKATGYGVTLECVEEIVLRTAALVSRPSEAGREAVIEECAKIADRAAKRCVREKIPGDSVADFVAQQIRALSPDQRTVAVASGHPLERLWRAIVDNTTDESFWTAEILLHEIEKETGFNGNGSPSVSSAYREGGK